MTLSLRETSVFNRNAFLQNSLPALLRISHTTASIEICKIDLVIATISNVCSRIISETNSVTHNHFLYNVKAFAAALRNFGVKAADIVTLYLPMTPDLSTAILSCSRIGAVHSFVFVRFNVTSHANCIFDANLAVSFTSDILSRSANRIMHNYIVNLSFELATVRDVVVDQFVALSH